ncbi:leucyl/phenylalanyl-tRNA--protein transferase [Deinobacterium chartae]|uniref:Leucyl/phenylalanyl-tRNA--protein transferase n=1 Tax=Deinobacterium chartae TaxID=521158 RepID=A0A841HYI0_9DEIO|nr:leucyl/phenylalanyl-tRNA--protein transferase [Deinobacterium chartae]MBB6097943.1 leucyl/phenylalanyl-tRNA--protein transferase [Deinobacterium chartae]
MNGTVADLLEGYARGYFLMADDAGELRWYSSRRHALIPLDERFHVPRSLRRALNSGRFEVRINADFEGVVRGCASRAETWISVELMAIYRSLHRAGFAHSFETWSEGRLAGGVLGIALGGAFIGETMFYAVPEASKVAMVRLVEHLRARGFVLFDAQLTNAHLERFGAYEVPEAAYRRMLRAALEVEASFVP